MNRRLALSLLLPVLLVLSCRPGGLAVRIVSPASETEYAVGDTVRLSAEGVDGTGQPLPDSAYRWKSSIDGALGTGSQVARALTPGFHRVEVVATDPGTGQTASDRILVLVTGGGGREGVELVRYMSSISKATLGVPLVQVELDPIKLFGQVTYTLTPVGLHNHPGGYNAAIGNGRMAVAFTREGTLNLLRWPSPSYFDQVDYLTSDRDLPRKGALPNMGSFAGVMYKKVDGTAGVVWMNGSGWTHRQSYLAEDANIVVTESEHAALGLAVKTIDLVLPDRDVLARRFRIERRAGSPVTEARFVYFENFAPSTTKFERLPLADWLLDPLLSDFACAYDSRDDLLLHFRPETADTLALARFVTANHPDLQADVDRWIDSLDSSFGKGSYLALGGDFASDAHQCGFDAVLSVDEKAAPDDVDAYLDAADGELSGHPLAAVRATGALARRLPTNGSPAEVTVYVAAAGSASDARRLVREARAVPFANHLQSAREQWKRWLARARLPRTSDAATLAISRRGLLSTAVATDRSTGAIVASVATQAPYGEDWPRDGSFINHALDLAGFPEAVERHNEFYARVQRTGWFLPGTMEMNYYADGTPGGPILFEIDEAALAVWTLWDHARFLPSSDRARYLGRVYAAIRRGTDFLASWRDPFTGLQAPAMEDDIPALVQGLQGAGTIVLALKSGIAAGRAAGEDPARLSRWESRRKELEAAILKKFWDPARNTFRDPASGLSTGAASWMIWPVEFLPYSDPRMQGTAEHVWAEVQDFLAKVPGRYGYEAKVALALAHIWGKDPAKRARVERLLGTLVRDVPTPDTLHYSEFYDFAAGNPRAITVNDVPHVWEHSLVYLTAMELHR